MRLSWVAVAGLAMVAAPLSGQDLTSDEEQQETPSKKSAVSVSLAAELRLRVESWSIIEDTGPSEDISFLYASLTGRFPN